MGNHAEDDCEIDTTYDNSANGNVRIKCTKDASYIGTVILKLLIE